MSARVVLGLWWLLAMFAGCGSDSHEPVDAAATDGRPPYDEAQSDHNVSRGYGVEGGNVFPPLYHRFEALPCEPGGACETDADCGVEQACVCLDWSFGQCLPAECRRDSDCASRRCLYSRGPSFGCCDDDIAEGLFCARPTSTCAGGDDCVGNGQACAFRHSTQHFQCALFSCGCGDP